MSNIQIIKERKVAELYRHPENESIYGDEDIQELAQSIKEKLLICGYEKWLEEG